MFFERITPFTDELMEKIRESWNEIAIELIRNMVSSWKKIKCCYPSRRVFHGTPSYVVVSTTFTSSVDTMILFQGDLSHYFGHCVYISGRNIEIKVPNES